MKKYQVPISFPSLYSPKDINAPLPEKYLKNSRSFTIYIIQFKNSSFVYFLPPKTFFLPIRIILIDWNVVVYLSRCKKNENNKTTRETKKKTKKRKKVSGEKLRLYKKASIHIGILQGSGKVKI
mgnify:CR=1 FL=1